MMTQVTITPGLAAWSLGKRELVRFFRQRNRIVGAIGTPLLFWLLFGAGLQQSFRPGAAAGPGQSFQEYYVPGSLMLIVLFTAIFTTISVIEDRKEGFLQAVLVSPVPRWEMVLGKVWGGSVIALLQGCFFLLISAPFQGKWELMNLLQLIPLLALAAGALTSLGFLLAWRTDSTQGFHAIMNLVLMPLWLLSGAFFPAPEVTADSAFSQWLVHWASRLNPLSYSVAGARRLLMPNVDWPGYWTASLGMAWVITLLFFAVTFWGACAVSRQSQTGETL